MSEIRFDTISHSWLAWDTENDQPLTPQPIIEAFTPYDIYYDARVDVSFVCSFPFAINHYGVGCKVTDVRFGG